MNKAITVLTMIFMSQISYAQITTTKVAERKEEVSTEPYDSLQNFLGKDVYKYIGQELYLKGEPESLRGYGFKGFLLDYTLRSSSLKNTYKPIMPEIEKYIKYDIGGGKSIYDSLVGKYFSVLAVHKHPKAEESENLYGSEYFLELKEKGSGDKVFYKYDSESKYSFPFIVVGYFVKQKELNMNKEFVVRGKNWLTQIEPMTDMNTGELVSFEPGSKWKCVDLTIEEKYFNLSLILQNQKGEKIPLFLDYADNTNFVFFAEDAEKYKKKYGDENWTKILEGEVVVGFTAEMVLLSWGIPEKINRASYGDQWVYDGKYLYFENGKLKSFN